ncbi:MAG: hypothetical protein ACE5RR_07675 [Nitrosarchaeum sp.]
MITSCRNCKKSFSAKNALFCSMNCYKIYTDAIERKEITPLADDICNHEYSKNGTMSCRKCGVAVSIRIK